MAEAILCHCGNYFQAYKASNRKYCSLMCYRVAQRSGTYKRGHGPDFPRNPCAYCGAVVERELSIKRNGEKSDKVFCNRGCYDKYRLDLRSDCLNCGSKVPIIGKKFCSDTCFKSHKKAKPKNCVNCGTLFTSVKYMAKTGKYISSNSGKTCSAKCQIEWISNNKQRKEKISIAFTGDKHPNWQGGSHYISSRGPGWQALRRKVKDLAGNKCEHCGITEDKCKERYKCGLHINHKIPFLQFGGKTQQANKLSNLEALCRSCHTRADHKWRRENPVQYYLADMFKS